MRHYKWHIFAGVTAVVSQPLTDRAPSERIDAAVHQMRDMPACADRLVKLGEVVEALRAEMRGGEGPVLVGWRAAADYIEREFGAKPDA